MFDQKFEESGLLAGLFGFPTIQLESSTKYVCEYSCHHHLLSMTVMLHTSMGRKASMRASTGRATASQQL